LIDLLKEKQLKKVDSNPTLKEAAQEEITLKPSYKQALEQRINSMRLHIAPERVDDDESDEDGEWN
jgi:hypothetical protein